MIWWIASAVAAVVLLAHWRGPNAVWGTATLGALIGVVIAIFQPGFDWSIVGKALVTGTFVGLSFEWLTGVVTRQHSKLSGGRILALVGIGLYGLQVYSSGTDANGNSVVPPALILLSGTATLVYLATAAVVLWRIDHKRVAVVLPLAFLATGVTIFMTPNPSSMNIIFNAIKTIEFVTYFYAVWLIFVCHGKRTEQRNVVPSCESARPPTG